MNNIQLIIKKVANNILEFLIDPTVYPPERHIYYRPEEILENSFYENAKKDSEKAYGDQRQNSDFYPNRPIREASSMERKTLIASLDVLSQQLNESNPIAKDLRTMAYAIAKMSEDDFKKIKTTDVEAKVKMVKCPKCGGNVVEKMGYCVKCKKKISEMKTAEEETVEKEAGKKKEPGIPDGTGPMKDSPECPNTEKEAGKKKVPGVPDGTGPMKDSPECPKSEKEAIEIKDYWNKEATNAIRRSLIAEVSEAYEEKKEVEAKKEVPKEKVIKEVTEVVETSKKDEKEANCGKPHDEEDEKEATVVDTDLLNATNLFEGIELQAGLITIDDVGDLSATEKERLDQLF